MAVDGEHGVAIGEARYISWGGRKLARKPGVPALVLAAIIPGTEGNGA